MADVEQREPSFEAVLYPNPPLSRSGFLLFMSAFALISFCAALPFILMGAWPVGGFFAFDLLLVYIAFRVARRTARWRELVRLDTDGLHVCRIDPDGRARCWRFEPYWVRVEMEEPPRPGSLVTLASHGRRLCIGAFLTPEERLDFARALRQALRRHRELPALSGAG